MGNKTMELHGGYGPIPTIKWKVNLVAWANDKVRVGELIFWQNAKLDMQVSSSLCRW